MQANFVPGGFFFFQVAPGRAPGVYTQFVCEVTIETWRYLEFKKLGFLEWQSTVPFSFFLLKYSFRRAMLQLKFQKSKSKPEESHFTSNCHRDTGVCTVGGDDVWTHTIQETRLSCRSTVAYFSFEVLSKTSNAPT